MQPFSSCSCTLHVLVLLVLLVVLPETRSFVPAVTVVTGRDNVVIRSFQPLYATKKNNKRGAQPSTSGFGGAAAESCPCGSDESYMKCCGKLHKKLLEFKKATPEQVVRARYTAYAKREIDFIIKSTHPLNPNFVGDIKHWKEQIDINCYDNFELTKCVIIEEIMIDDTTATVCFVAEMMQRDSRERTAFQETSTFERIGGIWLYKSGVIAEPPGRESEQDTTESSSEKEVDVTPPAVE